MAGLNRRGFLRRATQLAGVVAGAAAVNVVDTALPAQAQISEIAMPLQPGTLTAVSLISRVHTDASNTGGSYLRWNQEAEDFIPVEGLHQWTQPRPVTAADLPRWTDPATWGPEMVTAQTFNHEIRDKLAYLKQALDKSGIITNEIV